MVSTIRVIATSGFQLSGAISALRRNERSNSAKTPFHEHRSALVLATRNLNECKYIFKNEPAETNKLIAHQKAVHA